MSDHLLKRIPVFLPDLTPLLLYIKIQVMKTKQKIWYYFKFILNILVYVLFFIYIFYFASHQEALKNRLLVGIVGTLIGLLALYFEIMRSMFDAGTKRLIYDGKPEEAMAIAKKIEKIDLFKTFSTSTSMMKMLAGVDMLKEEELKNALDSLDEKSRNDYDTLLVYYHSLLIYHGERDEASKVKAAYKKLNSLHEKKTSKGKPYKGSYFFNWENVTAAYEFYQKEYDKAYTAIKKVDISRMNSRELMHYHLMRARIEKAVKKDYKESLDKARSYTAANTAIQNYIDSL